MMQWDKQKLKSNIEYCIERIDNGIEQFGDTFFPLDASVSGRYDCFYNRSWIPGFWTGLLMLAYEFTQKEKYNIDYVREMIFYKNKSKKRTDIKIVNENASSYEVSKLFRPDRYSLVFRLDAAGRVKNIQSETEIIDNMLKNN